METQRSHIPTLSPKSPLARNVMKRAQCRVPLGNFAKVSVFKSLWLRMTCKNVPQKLRKYDPNYGPRAISRFGANYSDVVEDALSSFCTLTAKLLAKRASEQRGMNEESPFSRSSGGRTKFLSFQITEQKSLVFARKAIFSILLSVLFF